MESPDTSRPYRVYTPGMLDIFAVPGASVSENEAVDPDTWKDDPFWEVMDEVRAEKRQHDEEVSYSIRFQARMEQMKRLCASAKARAKKAGIPFNLEWYMLDIPEKCPLLGTPFKRGKGQGKHRNTSPTLDRKVPSRGYVRDNVWFISGRANRIKSDATTAELEMIVAGLKKAGVP